MQKYAQASSAFFDEEHTALGLIVRIIIFALKITGYRFTTVCWCI